MCRHVHAHLPRRVCHEVIDLSCQLLHDAQQVNDQSELQIWAAGGTAGAQQVILTDRDDVALHFAIRSAQASGLLCNRTVLHSLAAVAPSSHAQVCQSAFGGPAQSGHCELRADCRLNLKLTMQETALLLCNSCCMCLSVSVCVVHTHDFHIHLLTHGFSTMPDPRLGFGHHHAKHWQSTLCAASANPQWWCWRRALSGPCMPFRPGPAFLQHSRKLMLQRQALDCCTRWHHRLMPRQHTSRHHHAPWVRPHAQGYHTDNGRCPSRPGAMQIHNPAACCVATDAGPCRA